MSFLKLCQILGLGLGLLGGGLLFAAEEPMAGDAAASDSMEMKAPAESSAENAMMKEKNQSMVKKHNKNYNHHGHKAQAKKHHKHASCSHCHKGCKRDHHHHYN